MSFKYPRVYFSILCRGYSHGNRGRGRFNDRRGGGNFRDRHDSDRSHGNHGSHSRSNDNRWPSFEEPNPVPHAGGFQQQKFHQQNQGQSQGQNNASTTLLVQNVPHDMPAERVSLLILFQN